MPAKIRARNLYGSFSAFRFKAEGQFGIFKKSTIRDKIAQFTTIAKEAGYSKFVKVFRFEVKEVDKSQTQVINVGQSYREEKLIGGDAPVVPTFFTQYAS
jgi:phosphorylcholine metabolism protein LicD